MNLRDLLLKALKMEEQGEFEELTERDLLFISDLIHHPDMMCRDEASKFLGISLTHFYELRNQGIIPEPRKKKGLRELLYYTSDLRKVLSDPRFHNSKTH